MAVTINGDGTISGVSVGGLPDGVVDSGTLATGIDATKLADGTITNSELQYINSLSSNAQTQISGAGGGKVLQVVHNTTAAAVNAGSTEVDTNLTATIVTSAANSKILVSIAQWVCKGPSGGTARGVITKLYQNSVHKTTFSPQMGYGFADGVRVGFIVGYYISTTIASASTSTTFKTRGYNNTASGVFEYQSDGTASHILLTEIGA
jgi:hypothetical protein